MLPMLNALLDGSMNLFCILNLALKCLSTEAKFRPKMGEVLVTLEQLVNPKMTHFVI